MFGEGRDVVRAPTRPRRHMRSEERPSAVTHWIRLLRNSLLSYTEMELHLRAAVLSVGSCRTADRPGLEPGSPGGVSPLLWTFPSFSSFLFYLFVIVCLFLSLFFSRQDFSV